MSTSLQLIRKDIASVRERFESVAIDKAITFERESGFALQILSANEYLTKVALDNKASMLAAVVNVSAIGISLNPAKRQAYLVPRDGRVCLDISYMGLLDLAIASGSIRWGQADLVYATDKFTLNGVDKPPTHERDPFAKDRGEVLGAYVVVKTVDGDYLTTAMSAAELFDIRDRSSAWKAWVEKKRKCPWVTDEGEMMKKTVIKRAYKLWPKTERLDPAVHYLNTEAGEGLELADHRSIKPTSGAFDAIDEDQLVRVRDIAERVRKGYANLGPEAAAEYIAEQEFDAEELTALWALFDSESEMRAAIKSAQAAQRLAA